MIPILERVGRGELLIADGAIGSLLLAQQSELIKGACPELLNLSKPEILEDIAALYLAAGANIIQTNTFGASPLRLADYGMEGQTESINRAAVQAVKKIVANRAYICASCGPSGKKLKPSGSVSVKEMSESFSRQIKALADAGPDIICVETMTDIEEAEIAVDVAKTLFPAIPVMATMTFNATPHGFYTFLGVSVERAAKALEQAGADIVGSNCGNGIEDMILIARQFRAHTALPLVIQSNAGLPIAGPKGLEYPQTPVWMAEQSRELIAAGVSIIGGCCGTTPEHIRQIAKVAEEYGVGVMVAE